MHRVLLCFAVLAASLAASSAEAAVARFRGSLNPAGNPGGVDPLGILSLPSQVYEIQLNTNNAGAVTGSYIVFQGKSFSFSSGTVVPGSPGAINNISLGTNNGTLAISLGSTLTADSQPAFDALIGGPAGTITITGPFAGGVNGVYFGGVTAIPEPSSTLALTSLVLGCGFLRRRRKA